jgi:hypothetical protein
MSHFTKIATKIHDLIILKKVLKELGYTYREGQVQVKAYRGITQDCDMVIETKAKYEIGVVKTQEGYTFVADWWGVETTAGIEQEVFVRVVNQRYAYHKVQAELEKKGFEVAEEKVDEHNNIKLVARKWE